MSPDAHQVSNIALIENTFKPYCIGIVIIEFSRKTIQIVLHFILIRVNLKI